MGAPCDVYFFRNICRIMELTVVVSISFVSVRQKWFESTRKKEGLGGFLVIGKELPFFHTYYYYY